MFYRSGMTASTIETNQSNLNEHLGWHPRVAKRQEDLGKGGVHGWPEL